MTGGSRRSSSRSVAVRGALVLACALGCAVAIPAVSPAPAWAQQAPKPENVKKATAHFEKASRLYDAKKYKEALEEFRASYAAVQSPNSHLYIARCLLALGDPKAAWLEFEKVIAEAEARAATEPKYAPTRDTAKLERDEVAAQLAFVTVTVQGADPGAKVRVAGAELSAEELGKPVPVTPGPVDVVLEQPGAAPVTRSLTLAAGEKKDVALSPPASPSTGQQPVSATVSTDSSDRSSLRPFAYIAGGVGVAGMALFTIAGIMTSSTYSDLEETCKGPCPPERQSDIDAGKTQQTLANVGLVVGAVGLAAGATLFVLSLGGGESEGQPRTGSTTRSLVVGPGWVGARGTF